MTEFILCQPQTKLVTDWTFWAFIVSALAIILSQVSPMKYWLRKVKLSLNIYPRIIINHKVGNPSLQTYISIYNLGSRDITIEDINFKIFRNDNELTTLHCRTFNNDESNNSGKLFIPFKLKKDSEWKNYLNFYNPLNKEREQDFRNLENTIKQDIANKRIELENKQQIVSADDENINPIINFMYDNFIWRYGDYKIILNVNTNSKDKKFSKAYRFVLFETDQQFLEDYKNAYKYGAGVTFDAVDHKGINVEIYEFNSV